MVGQTHTHRKAFLFRTYSSGSDLSSMAFYKLIEQQYVQQLSMNKRISFCQTSKNNSWDPHVMGPVNLLYQAMSLSRKSRSNSTLLDIQPVFHQSFDLLNTLVGTFNIIFSIPRHITMFEWYFLPTYTQQHGTWHLSSLILFVHLQPVRLLRWL